MKTNNIQIKTNTKKYSIIIGSNIIKNIKNIRINKNDKNYSKYYFETGINLKNNIYTSYDHYLNDKYKITINQQTIERLKNHYK